MSHCRDMLRDCRTPSFQPRHGPCWGSTSQAERRLLMPVELFRPWEELHACLPGYFETTLVAFWHKIQLLFDSSGVPFWNHFRNILGFVCIHFCIVLDPSVVHRKSNPNRTKIDPFWGVLKWRYKHTKTRTNKIAGRGPCIKGGVGNRLDYPTCLPPAPAVPKRSRLVPHWRSTLQSCKADAE